MRKIILITLCFTFTCALAQDCTEAEKCDKDQCTAANHCHCSGEEVVVPLTQRPQIVYLTFDDAFTAQAEDQFYRLLFNGTYKNPNGCNIRATHFLTQSYTDYSLVNQYWHWGHEMAAHSITHRNNQTYWQTMSPQEWRDEMVGVRRMIAQFGNIPACEVKGARAPFLQGGGDNMFQMLAENNFLYDSSWPTRQYGYIDAEYAIFPYTLDYKTKQDCPIEPCPHCSWPGVWEQPMIDLEDEWIGSNPSCPECGNACSMLDACVIMGEATAEHVYQMLKKNFDRVYHGEEDELGFFVEGSRAPWGLYMHAAWFFGQQWHYDGYKMFIEEITNSTKYPDVYIVPVEAGLRYMQAPMDKETIAALGKKDTSPFGCEAIEAQSGKYAANPCGAAQLCGPYDVFLPEENINHEQRYMTICKYITEAGTNGRQSCPDEDSYPWLGDNCGGSEPCSDWPWTARCCTRS